MSTVDMDARLAAYRRQNGRSALTPRQMRQVVRKFNHQAAKGRRAAAMRAASDVTPERTI